MLSCVGLGEDRFYKAIYIKSIKNIDISKSDNVLMDSLPADLLARIKDVYRDNIDIILESSNLSSQEINKIKEVA